MSVNSEIEQVLDQYVRPVLTAHGGSIGWYSFQDGEFRFRFSGECALCPSAWITAEQVVTTALMCSQFCYHFQQYAEKNRATMHIPRKPGDSIEVDWAGDKLYIVDRDAGEANAVYLFVGVLPYNMYAYAEACPKMDMECWIQAHVNMFGYFGGSTVMSVALRTTGGNEYAESTYF